MSHMRGVALVVLASVYLLACGQPADTGDVRHVSLKVTDASAGFGLRLTQTLLAEPDAGNVFVSPLSAVLALSMIASAADGETRTGLLRGLGLDPSVDPSAEVSETIKRLAQSDSNSQVELAQAVWVQNGLKLDPAYVSRLRNDYRARLANLDFTSPQAAGIVNRWVSDSTHGTIKELIDQFDPSTVAFLANATYFHASWPTELAVLKDVRHFTTFTGASVPVTMMQSEGPSTLITTPTYHAMLLRYRGGRFSFLVILPNGVLTPSAFSRFLTPVLWNQTFGLLHQARGESVAGSTCTAVSVNDSTTVGCGAYLQLPRFKLDYGADLTKTLGALGMPVPGAALPRICSGCALTYVVQKTHIEVDEKGTTASAATGGAAAVSLPMTVVLDHPFALALIDNATDAPLFMGVVGQL